MWSYFLKSLKETRENGKKVGGSRWGVDLNVEKREKERDRERMVEG